MSELGVVGKNCTDSQICHNCAKIALHNFVILWWDYENKDGTVEPRTWHSIYHLETVWFSQPITLLGTSKTEPNYQHVQ